MKFASIVSVVITVLLAFLFSLILALPVMWLWNATLPEMFGFKEIGTWLYDHAGDEDGPHKGSGNIRVRLPKKNKEDPMFLGKVIAPWLRDNLHLLLKRGVSSVYFKEEESSERNMDGTHDLWFNFNFQL